MARCGYRTVALLPMRYSFVNEGLFLHSLGFDTILDYDGIGASQYVHRDWFYFEAAEKVIQEHRKNDGRPLFLTMQTMFPHSPYDVALAKETGVQVDDHTDLEAANEYLQRVQVSRADFTDFLAARAADPSARGTVVAEFGDHQSFATKSLIDDASGLGSLSDLKSGAYRTHFTMYAFGHQVHHEALGDKPLDIAFLGATLLEWGGLPDSPLYKDLRRLRDL
jgi:phosphoglycerol transferase MdoB-like AlkP superfamily enzyme